MCWGYSRLLAQYNWSFELAGTDCFFIVVGWLNYCSSVIWNTIRGASECCFVAQSQLCYGPYLCSIHITLFHAIRIDSGRFVLWELRLTLWFTGLGRHNVNISHCNLRTPDLVVFFPIAILCEIFVVICPPFHFSKGFHAYFGLLFLLVVTFKCGEFMQTLSQCQNSLLVDCKDRCYISFYISISQSVYWKTHKWFVMLMVRRRSISIVLVQFR